MLFHAIGFGLYVSWLWMLFLEGPLLAPAAALWQIQPNNLFLLFLCCNSIGFYFLGFTLRTRSLIVERNMFNYCAVLLSLGPVLLGGIPFLDSEIAANHAWLAYVLAGAAGFAGAPFMAVWLEFFTMIRLDRAAAVLAGAITIATGFTLLGGVVKLVPGLMIIAIMPIASLALIKKQTRHWFNYQVQGNVTAGLDPFPIRIKVLFALFYIAGGLMFKIVTLEQSFPYLFCVANISYAVITIIAAVLFHYSSKYDLSMLYRPTLPLLSIGFLLFFSRWENQLAIVSFLLIQAGFALFDMYTWLLIVRIANHHAKPAAVCCMGLFLITFSILSGNLAFTMFNVFMGNQLQVEFLALIAGVLSLMSALVFSDSKEVSSDKDGSVYSSETDILAHTDITNQAAQMDTLDFECKQEGEGSVLTEREKEVLGLLLKGRSARVIGETLNVSANTVKFHIKNIYEKTGVKNRQKLLDMFENF